MVRPSVGVPPPAEGRLVRPMRRIATRSDQPNKLRTGGSGSRARRTWPYVLANVDPQPDFDRSLKLRPRPTYSEAGSERISVIAYRAVERRNLER